MKKLSLLACLMTVTTGLAMATTVSIPFFSDNGTVRSCFVGLQNTDTVAQSITVIYLDKNGLTENRGTFTLQPNQSISYRPNTAVGGAEVQPAGLPDAGYKNGSITFESTGSLAGRFVQIDSQGSFAHNLEVN